MAAGHNTKTKAWGLNILPKGKIGSPIRETQSWHSLLPTPSVASSNGSKPCCLLNFRSVFCGSGVAIWCKQETVECVVHFRSGVEKNTIVCATIRSTSKLANDNVEYRDGKRDKLGMPCTQSTRHMQFPAQENQ